MIRNIEVKHYKGFDRLMVGEWQYILKKFPVLKRVSITIPLPYCGMGGPQNMDTNEMNACVEQGQKTFEVMKGALKDGLKEKVTCQFVLPE